MTIVLSFHKQLTNPIHRQDVLRLLVECDDEFLPSLSSKRIQPNNIQSKEELLMQYMKEKDTENYYILAYDNQQLVGFLNFVPRYQVPGFPLSNDVDTTCVQKEYRNKGIARRLYTFLETSLPSNVQMSYVTRTTWSKNATQLHLYQQFGYTLLEKKEHDRGEGVHTLVFGKKIKDSSTI